MPPPPSRAYGHPCLRYSRRRLRQLVVLGAVFISGCGFCLSRPSRKVPALHLSPPASPRQPSARVGLPGGPLDANAGIGVGGDVEIIILEDVARGDAVGFEGIVGQRYDGRSVGSTWSKSRQSVKVLVWSGSAFCTAR